MDDYIVGNIGCALLTDKDQLYLGVCIDVGSGMGFCAEHNAIGTMVTAGEYKIKKIVAVGKGDNGEIFVLPPCGRCREFMYQIDKSNLETEAVLGKDKVTKLSELLLYHNYITKIIPRRFNLVLF